jgi:hypothetical protein
MIKENRVRQSLHQDVIIVNPAPPAGGQPDPGKEGGMGKCAMMVLLILLLIALAFVSGFLTAELRPDGLCCLSVDVGYDS